MPLVVEIILSILAVGGLLGTYYLHARVKIREAIEGAINAAEELELIGAEKMKMAVKIVSDIVPVGLKPFLTDKVLEALIQGVFDAMEEFARKQVK
jgi:hypothetical protein